jgi:hypothetical protein
LKFENLSKRLARNGSHQEVHFDCRLSGFPGKRDHHLAGGIVTVCGLFREESKRNQTLGASVARRSIIFHNSTTN